MSLIKNSRTLKQKKEQKSKKCLPRLFINYFFGYKCSNFLFFQDSMIATKTSERDKCFMSENV